MRVHTFLDYPVVVSLICLCFLISISVSCFVVLNLLFDDVLVATDVFVLIDQSFTVNQSLRNALLKSSKFSSFVCLSSRKSKVKLFDSVTNKCYWRMS